MGVVDRESQRNDEVPLCKTDVPGRLGQLADYRGLQILVQALPGIERNLEHYLPCSCWRLAAY